MKTFAHIRQGSSSVILTSLRADTSATPTMPRDPDKTDTQEYANWGEDNLYPNWVMKQIKDVTLIKPLLQWKSEALFGGGVAYGIEKYENGKEVIEPLYDLEIEEWMQATVIEQYLMEAASNFYHFYNIFPELTQSLDGSRINFLTCKESLDARWAKRDEKDGYIKKMYLSPDWSQYADTKSKDVASFDVINPFRHPPEVAKEKWQNKGLIYSVAYPSPGKSYYQEAPWQVLLKSWLPIAKAIPEYKSSILTNQLSIRYIIRVPEGYWKDRYPKWDDLPEKKKEELMDEEHDYFDKFIHSKEKGKSLLVSKPDEMQGEKKAQFEIEAVNHKMDKGIFIEDSQEADAHIFKNMQVDQTLFGNGAGKGVGAGSGSDKRVAWNMYQQTTKAHQRLILSPLDYIARYNGWKKRLEAKHQGRLKFYYKNYMIARLDEGKETKSETNPVKE